MLNILVPPSTPNSPQKTLYYLPLNFLSYFLINYFFIYFNPLSSISAAHVCRNVRTSSGA